AAEKASSNGQSRRRRPLCDGADPRDRSSSGSSLPAAKGAEIAGPDAACRRPSQAPAGVVLLPSAKREFRQQFYRFLCKSPLVSMLNATIAGSAAFHQQYWLEPENRLIMVGVVDILPRLHLVCLGLPHYCMGYYIHDASRCVTKALFEGSELLCPETYTWQLFANRICPIRRSGRYLGPGASLGAPGGPRHGSANFMPYSQMERMLSGRPSLLAMLAELAAEIRSPCRARSAPAGSESGSAD
uniref:ATE_C domain-containing protein n=1 Tax=Macrostomum lignano TaxID=282301 RepID=A0A1I8FIH8_9PLAT